MWSKRHFMWLSIRAEMKAACYAGSWLGSGWWLLEPLLLMFVYLFVVQVLRGDKSSPFGALFIFCGVLPYRWFAMTMSRSMGCILTGGNLIKQVPFPKMMLPIAATIANTLHFLFGCVILVVMLFLYKVPLSPLVLWFPFIVLVQFVMSLAFALFLASATVFVRDVQGVVPFLLRTLLFVSPILYNLEDVPKEMQGLYMFNPLTSVVTSYKYVLLYQRPPLLGPLLIVLAVSLLLIAGGVLLTVRLDKIYARWL